MGASLSLSISVTNTSDTAATVKVTLKVKSTSGSWNAGSQYGYITIDGTKYEFHHSFKANTTTTLATKSKSISRTTSNKTISIKGYYKTGVSPGNISKSGSTTVSARPQYNVTFNANGGTNGKTVAVYSGYTTTFPSTTRTGYNFGSWSGYAQGATTPAITSARTYTASWTEKTATLSYNANGRGTAPGSTTMKYTAATTAANMGNVAGSEYHFTNWSTNAAGTGTKYNAGAVVKAANVVPSNTTLYAQWALNTYTVTYNANGGTVTPASMIKKHGETISVPTPTWTGHIFAGWVTSGGKGQNIGLEECSLNGVNHNDTIALTAEWSNAVRPVILHYHKSATDINNTSRLYKIFAKDIALSNIADPSITNYVFKGWYTDIEYTSEWTGFNYENDYYEIVEQPAANPKAQGYYELSNGRLIETTDTAPVEGKDYYLPNTAAYEDENIEPLHLYAKWNELYTVVFNNNTPTYDDGIEVKGAIDSIVIENGVSTNLPFKTYTIIDNPQGNPSEEGYYEYNEEGQYVITQDTEVNSEHTYYLFDYLKYSKDGDDKCIFAGWDTDSLVEAEQVTYADEEGKNKITLNGLSAGETYNLYAIWNPTEYTITLEKGDEQATGERILISKRYFETYHLPVNIDEWTYINHHLLNWTTLELDTEIIITQNITYTARWVFSYHVPVISSIKTQRYLESNYITRNDAGKYLQITAEGQQGSYDNGDSFSKYTYNVGVRFYEQKPDNDAYILTEDKEVVDGKDYFEINENNNAFILIQNPIGNPKEQKWYELTGIEPVARYLLTLENDGYVLSEDTEVVDGKTYYQKENNIYTEVSNPTGSPSAQEWYEFKFFQRWGGPLDEEKQQRPILDKKLQMLYCILTITDTTHYKDNIFPIDSPERIFTYEFEVLLKRGIGMHMADDLSAITMFDELAEGDEGLILTKSFSMNRLWTWKIDSAQHLYLEWTGGTNNE